MVVMIAVMLIAFLATLALSIDIAYMQLTRTELRTATDAAARAGAEALSRDQSIGLARKAIKRAAARNFVAGAPLQLQNQDIIFGSSKLQADGSWKFEAGGTPTNAVRVLGRRTDDSQSGSVSLFFGRVFGRDSFEPVQEAVASQLERDICIVMDRSGSMAFDLSGVEWSYPPDGQYCTRPHPTLSRWAAAAAAVEVFLDEIGKTKQDEQVGFVTYASPGTWCRGRYNAADIEIELTPNFTRVAMAVLARGRHPIPGGTSISAGIDKGIDVLTNPDTARIHAVKTMIVLTDGIHNWGPAPINSAYVAKDRAITIHTITFSDGADQTQMQEVAEATGGQHYHAPDAQALLDIFKQIAATLPVMLTE